MHDIVHRVYTRYAASKPPGTDKATGMKVDPATTGLAFTDLHNDFLAPNGKAYPLIEQSLTKNNTAHNIERLLRTGGISVAEFEPQVRHLRPRVRDIVGVQDLGHASIRL